MKQHKTQLIPDSDLVKAWSILDNLKPSEIMELKRIPEDRREVFISCAKTYCDLNKNIEFNSNYTKIKKTYSIKDLYK